jgi:hypothetical protein
MVPPNASKALTSFVSVANVVGSTTPRLWTPPLVTGPPGPCGCGCALTDETSYGFDVDTFARNVLEAPLDPWERFLVIHGGELLPDGRPRFRKLLVIVARQNGKTHVLVVLSLFWLYVEAVGMVLGTSTNLVYAKESWAKAVSLAQSVDELAEQIPQRGGVRETNGEQELTVVHGKRKSRYKVAAANRRGGRSLTVDRYIADELREHDTFEAWSAAYNAMNAVPDAQAWAITNQGDEKAVVLDSLRGEIVDEDDNLRPAAEVDQRLGLFEYSSPRDSDPEDVTALAQSNPNLGIRIDVNDLLGDARRAKRNGGEELAQFKTEIMCIRVQILDPAIDQEAWADCLDPGEMSGLRNRTALCFDVAMDGQHATLYAAAQMEDGRVRIEPIAAWSGPTATQDLRRDLPRFVAKVKPRKVGWFPSGPAAAVAAAMTKRQGVWPPRQVRVEEIRGEVTAVCMGFAEQVRTKQIAHSDDPLLNAQASMTEKSYMGDGWRYTRRNAGHCDATYAAAGATHLARTLPKRPVRAVSSTQEGTANGE